MDDPSVVERRELIDEWKKKKKRKEEKKRFSRGINKKKETVRPMKRGEGKEGGPDLSREGVAPGNEAIAHESAINTTLERGRLPGEREGGRGYEMTRNYTRSKREKRSFSKLVFILPHFGRKGNNIANNSPRSLPQRSISQSVVSSELRKLEGG